ncbi:MAG: DNA mismatch repair endonuclease MutL [Clostridia bacterium]|nr:DNA mismatch repair endonuclease MutL [Clostridia bacterium]
MGIINVLDIEVANLIAAGEVVERPANAVKELVENSVDAGARSISVEITGGGIRSLRVTDDGCGMSAEDAVVAVRRHATSKLRRADDLAAIMTLGFRGEALAAITAIAKFRLLTKRREDAEGTSLSGEYGKVTEIVSEGCPDGTTIVCEKLFAATPARLKFLKSESSEASAVAGALEKLALSHPEIAFRFISDGILKFSTSGDGNLKNAIYSVYGSAFAKNLIAVDTKSGGIGVSGFTCSPENLRGNRGMQQFFINERCVRSKTLTSALEAAYRSYIPSGKFPSCVLHVSIPAKLVDVNIHPAKLEVKFSDEKAVFDAVFAAIRRALSVGIARPGLNLAEIAEKTQEKEKLQNLFREAEEKGERSEASGEKPPLSAKEPEPPTAVSEPPAAPKRAPIAETEVKQPRQLSFEDDDLPVDVPVPGQKRESIFTHLHAPSAGLGFEAMKSLYTSAIRRAETAKPDATPPPAVPAPSEEKILQAPTHPIPAYRITGEIFASYIIVETDDKILMVDKHAAHERINFERLRANMTMDRPNVQMILTPETIALSTEEAAFCEEYRSELEACGFEFSVSQREITMTGFPLGFEKEEARTLLLALISESLNGASPLESTKRGIFERALYQSACKASVKAGRIYDGAHLRWICDNLFRYDCIKYCPHGRPVAFEISKKEIDTRFGRD